MKSKNNGAMHLWKQYVISRVSDSTLERAGKFYQARGGVKLFLFAKETIKHLPTVCKIIAGKYVYIYQMDLVLTTRCTLRCRDCSNLMQYYEHPADVDYETIIKSIDVLCRFVDEISTITLLGGEPLLYSHLEKTLNYLIQQSKIRRIRVITNGTLPINNAELKELLKNPKIYVYISNYGTLSRKREELCQMFQRERITHYIAEQEVTWADCGNLKKRNRSEAELKEQFERCASDCLSLFKGKLYHCPRSAHGTDLGFIPINNADCVNLLDETSVKRKLIQMIYRRIDYIAACDYCDKGMKSLRTIPAAVQVKGVIEGTSRS